jgi:hypothetical protein
MSKHFPDERKEPIETVNIASRFSLKPGKNVSMNSLLGCEG